MLAFLPLGSVLLLSPNCVYARRVAFAIFPLFRMQLGSEKACLCWQKCLLKLHRLAIMRMSQVVSGFSSQSPNCFPQNKGRRFFLNLKLLKSNATAAHKILHSRLNLMQMCDHMLQSKTNKTFFLSDGLHYDRICEITYTRVSGKALTKHLFLDDSEPESSNKSGYPRPHTSYICIS